MKTYGLALGIVILAGTSGCMWYRATTNEDFGGAFDERAWEVRNIEGAEATPHKAQDGSLHFAEGDKFYLRRTLTTAYLRLDDNMAQKPSWSAYASEEIPFKSFLANDGAIYLCNDNVSIDGERHVVKLFITGTNVGGFSKHIKITYDDYEGDQTSCVSTRQHNGEAHAWI